MDKGTHFIGQPMYGQLISLLDKSKILKFSRENGGERYVKHFDAWQHLVIMLYAVIKRFDSLREITDSMFPEIRKFAHLGISMTPRRNTLSDANAHYTSGDILAIDRAYIDYAKFEELTARGVTYVTKMKKSLVYSVDSDTMYMSGKGLMVYRVQHVTFRRHVKDGEDVVHHASEAIHTDAFGFQKSKEPLVSLCLIIPPKVRVSQILFVPLPCLVTIYACFELQH